jgi:DNA end-binding protein Ku
MLWPDEVRRPAFSFQDETVDVKPAELEMASMFVGAFDQGFDPEQFHDQYREALQAVVDAKLSGHDIVRTPEAEGDSNVIDLMDALRASLAQASAGNVATDSGDGTESATEPAEEQNGKKTAKKSAAKKAAKAPAKKAAKAPGKKAAKKTAAKKSSTRKSA